MLKTISPNGIDFNLDWDGVWIAIPAYNEAATIRNIAEQSLAICPRVIVIDDGSSDATAEQLSGLDVTLLIHDVNQGKAACLQSAFLYASKHDARCVITIDGDGQHDPQDISRLLTVWLRHKTSVVIGARLHDKSHFPKARYCANRVACFWISWAANHPIADSQSGFRVYPIEVINMVLGGKVKAKRFAFESEVLIEASSLGFYTVAVQIPGRYPQNARPSHFRPFVDISKIVLMVAGKLIRQGMAPAGLIKCLRPAQVFNEENDNVFDRSYINKKSTHQ